MIAQHQALPAFRQTSPFLRNPSKAKQPRTPRHAVIPSATLSPAARKLSHGLTDPARLSGSSKSTVHVHDQGGSLSLAAYMRLPAEQYYELDPDMIKPLGGNRFKLKVPRIQLFNVYVEPDVNVVVFQERGPPHKVILQAEECHLYGSPFVQRMQLDKRFKLHFTTELTYSSPLSSNSPASTTKNTKKHDSASIHADLKLEVFTEVIPPFDVLPRSVLEGTCNAVIAGLIRTLLPVFLKRLGKDYTRWATNADYRKKRALLAAVATEQRQ